MPDFYLIDQSLKGVGGHHFDYTQLVAQAAAAAGRKVVIGCHRKFRHPALLAGAYDFVVRSCFRFTTYAACSNLIGIQDMISGRKQGRFLPRFSRCWNFARQWIHSGTSRNTPVPLSDAFTTEQQERIHAFANDLESFFQRPLASGDVVFFPTLSDLEAEGLRLFLSGRPDALAANWHIQFHFPLFRGRTPSYPLQLGRIDALKNTLDALRQLPANIRYYVTSETLRQQYRMTGFDFENLAYPIHPDFQAGSIRKKSPSKTARLAFAGAIRQEKGKGRLERLIDGIRQGLGSTATICVQKKKPGGWSRLRSFWKKRRPDPPNMETYPFPLGPEDYREFIRSADLGLLTTYDPDAYFSRRAGILGEYLAAGVPVIVPAGSWLADQIDVQQQQYLHQLVEGQAELETGVSMTQCEILRVRPLSESTDSRCRTVARFELRELGSPQHFDYHLLVIEFDARIPNEAGNYFRVSATTDSPETQLTPAIQTIGQDPRQKRRRVAFRLRTVPGSDQQSAKVAITIEPAFDETPWQLENLAAVSIQSAKPIPRSSTGLIAASVEQTPMLAREVIEQYEHYRGTAEAAAPTWYAKHDPRLTVETLIRHSGSQPNEFKDEAA